MDDEAGRFEPEESKFHLLLVDDDPVRAAFIVEALDQVAAQLQLTVSPSIWEALLGRRLLAVDAVLVRFTGSVHDVGDCHTLARACSGAAVFWLLDDDDIVPVAYAVDARISGAFHWTQIGPAEAFLRRIMRLTGARRS